MKKNKWVNTLGISFSREVVYKNPRAESKHSENLFDMFTKLLLIFVGTLGVLGCLNDGFTIDVEVICVNVVMLMCCMYFLAMQLLNGRKRLGLKVVGAAVFIIIVLIFRETVASSFMGLYCAVAENYNTYYGINLPVFETDGTGANAALMICMLPVCGFLTCAVSKRKFVRYLLIMLPYPLLCMVCGHMPTFSSLAYICVSIFGIIIGWNAVSNSVSGIRLRRDNALQSGVYGYAFTFTIILFLISMYLGYGFFYPRVSEKVEPVKYALYNSSIRDIYAQLRHRTSKGGLSGGSISGRTSLEYDNSIHLVVKSDTDVDYYTYLKGYVGVNYEGNSWSGLSDDVYDTAAYRALLEYDEDDILSLSYNLIQYARMAYSSDIFDDFSAVRWYVTVPDETVGDGYYLCFPYAGLASSTDGDINDLAWMSRRYEDGLENVYDSYSFTGSSIYSYAESDAEEVDYYCTGVIYGGAAGEYLAETVELEAIYREFVYENYLDVPDSVSRLYEEYSAYADDFDTLSGAIKFVKSEVADGATYTLSPNPLPYGEDFIEYFMYESKSGYCVYFASAAVMIFRSLGIPARFVEGYLIPPVTANEEVSIEDSNAHAWVEVYVNGFGWLPVEVTPGYYGEAGGFTPDMNKDTDTPGTGNEKETETENVTEEETEEESETETVTEESSEEEQEASSEMSSYDETLDESGVPDESEGGETADGSEGETANEGGTTEKSDINSPESSNGNGDGTGDAEISGTDESGDAGSPAFVISDEVIRALEVIGITVLVVLAIAAALLAHRRAIILKRRKRFNQKSVRGSILNIYRELGRMSGRYYIPVNESSGFEELLEGYPLEEEEWEQFFAVAHEAAFSDHEMDDESRKLLLSVYNRCCRHAFARLGFIKKAVFTVWDGYR